MMEEIQEKLIIWRILGGIFLAFNILLLIPKNIIVVKLGGIFLVVNLMFLLWYSEWGLI